MTGSQPVVTLDGGVDIPQLGFGVFQIPPVEAQAATEAALAAGYRHIDTAAAYNNESGVGEAVRASGLPRHEIFITTKLRNGDQGLTRTREAYDQSLERLGLDYVDLYLIHWPSPARGLFAESWDALAQLVEDGRVRAIGVSNFLPEHLQVIVGRQRQPAVNQVEVHPSFQQRATLDDCRSRGIAVEAYSPLGQGVDLSHPIIARIAMTHGKTAAQTVLRWHLQSDRIVIPKTVSPTRMTENADIFDFELSPSELTEIDGIDSAVRIGGNPRDFEMSQIR